MGKLASRLQILSFFAGWVLAGVEYCVVLSAGIKAAQELLVAFQKPSAANEDWAISWAERIISALFPNLNLTAKQVMRI